MIDDDSSDNIVRYKSSTSCQITSEDESSSSMSALSHVSTTSGGGSTMLGERFLLRMLSSSSSLMEEPSVSPSSPSTGNNATGFFDSSLKRGGKRSRNAHSTSANLHKRKKQSRAELSVELPPVNDCPTSTQTAPSGQSMSAEGRDSPVLSTHTSSSETSSCHHSSQRHAAPMGKRRVYSCNPEYGVIQTDVTLRV